MSDEKKPTEEPGKELDAEELENVAGGLLPASGETAFKFFRPNPTGDGTTVKVAPDGGNEAPTESITFVYHKIQ